MPHRDRGLIRRCFELAEEAVRKGNEPFGALLERGGEIVLEAANTVGRGDHTRHAELNLAALAMRRLPPEVVAECRLYSSTEPCAMCAGAIVWSGVSAVVYGCSAEGLAAISRSGFVLPCREVFAAAARPIEVVGPVAEEEGLAQHVRFWPGARDPS